MRSHLSFRALTAAALSFSIGVFLASAAVQGVAAQTAQTVAALHQPAAAVAVHDEDAKTGNSASGAPSVTPDPEVPPAVARQLAALQAEIEELKAALKSRDAAEPVATAPATAATGPATLTTPVPASPVTAVAVAPPSSAPIEKAVVQAANDASAAAPAKKEKIAPFSDWDWTWLNGNPRNKDTAFDSKFFTPEIRADVTYSYSFNKPVDNSMGGSSELFRSNEIQLEQLGLGGDFHLDNVRARFMTQFGMYSTATVRNDPSYAKGQWNIGDADRYVSEAYGGYHLDVLDGVNIDAGIFMSYIGLFSYYNFDNWAYQPSYVSSNTPWFFQGVRIQIFPNPHLKIEPWIINGWQSYGSSNSRKGLGGQIKWTPYSWMNIVSNNYGIGHDDLYIQNRGRIHTDNSIEIKYFDRPGQFLDKMAFSFTGDLGCEYGPSTATLAGVSCFTNKRDRLAQPSANFPLGGIDPKQSFVGYMLYDRTWFKNDHHAVTIGGGQINNPGRYLVLLPPINGETASSAAINAPYFTGNPGDPFKAWDTSFTYDYMPKQWLTFRWEYDYRHASVPYWSGKGGVTPPGSGGVPYTNNGFPQYYACMNGTNTGFGNSSALSMSANEAIAQTACAGQGSSLWTPDLRRDESLIDIDIMVKF
ncbi:MAG: outer membrane beta-barrel protein [Candidatus Sulfotelmatobacter sp.]